MTRVSKWFTEKEVTCGCGCGFSTLTQDVLTVADDIRDHIGQPITPSSACRCVDHNIDVGGAPRSRHLPRMQFVSGRKVMAADAMDLPVPDPRAIADYIDENYESVSYIVYPTFIHVDTRALHGASRYRK